MRDLLGPDAVRDLDALDDLVEQLERAGYLERDGDRLELTPRATRRIGQKVLDELFARLRRDAFGGHRQEPPGAAATSRRCPSRSSSATRSSSTCGRRWATPCGARRTRRPRGPRGGRAVRLRPEDFEVYRTERTTSAATVLLVDMSRSMLLRGCYLAAKRVAIALDTLIRTQYPRDHLSIVGFAYYARELRPEALAELSLARLRVRHQPPARAPARPPDPRPAARGQQRDRGHHRRRADRALRGRPGRVQLPADAAHDPETLREVVRCTKDGITINTFMLERTPALTDFVGLVTELNRGRAFYAEPEHLGEYVLVDFVKRRTSRVS